MRGVSFTAAKMTYMLSLMGMMCWLRLGTASLERSGACAGAGSSAQVHVQAQERKRTPGPGPQREMQSILV